MKFSIYLIVLGLLFFSCTDSKQNTIVYDTDESIDDVEKVENVSYREMVDLPIHIDSTDYLMFPVGQFNFYGRRNSGFTSSYSKSKRSSNSSYYEDKISGNLRNIKFRQIGSNSSIELTDKSIVITRATFLREVFNNLSKQNMIYNVFDKDTNRDGLLDDNDLQSLYISNIDGSDFARAMPQMHDLIEWKVVGIMSRVYYTTIEDSNKNGFFDKDDQLHYFYIDFNETVPQYKEYYP